jgi:pantoate--beta-alanine ligase
MTPRVIETVKEMTADAPGRPRAVVMTMGALHRGHAALIADARRRIGPQAELLVSVFVNPLQFGPGEDFDRYPRTWDADLAMCDQQGVDLVFAPAPDDMYAGGRDITIDAGPRGSILEGVARPGHFNGMLTVVNKLMNLTRPDLALYGEKDYQQLVLIRATVAVLNLPVTVVGSPTIREPDGLALSSRNTYLSAGERETAQVIPRATAAAVAAARAGATGDDVVAAVHEVFAEGHVVPDYVAVTDVELGPAPDRGEARLLVAARIGAPRLIDNVALTLDPA